MIALAVLLPAPQLHARYCHGDMARLEHLVEAAAFQLHLLAERIRLEAPVWYTWLAERASLVALWQLHADCRMSLIQALRTGGEIPVDEIEKRWALACQIREQILGKEAGEPESALIERTLRSVWAALHLCEAAAAGQIALCDGLRGLGQEDDWRKCRHYAALALLLIQQRCDLQASRAAAEVFGAQVEQMSRLCEAIRDQREEGCKGLEPDSARMLCTALANRDARSCRGNAICEKNVDYFFGPDATLGRLTEVEQAARLAARGRAGDCSLRALQLYDQAAREVFQLPDLLMP
ncbi:MAG: hypothetical protein JXR96_29535 [Deltaproteobacteria bacterium]|nr:hypothetical protein [Deltaproteobacteria bacterium]